MVRGSANLKSPVVLSIGHWRTGCFLLECRRAQQTLTDLADLTVAVEVAAREGREHGERGRSSSALHGRRRKTECLCASRYCDWAERAAADAGRMILARPIPVCIGVKG